MMNYRQTLGMGALIVLLLAGCGSNEQASETTASPSATPSAPASPNPTTTPSPNAKAMKNKAEKGEKGKKEVGKPEFAPLHTVANSTKAAVEAGDFAKAKAEFAQFENAWSKVEDGVKAKSSETYNAIEAQMDEITGELKAAKPQRDKVLTALKTLNKEVWKAEKAK